MSLQDLISPFTWALYSKKLKEKIANPRNVGYFSKEDADERKMRLVEGKAGSVEDGNVVCLYGLVDQADGLIVDVKFQVYGQSALIGAAEAVCEILAGRHYFQAMRVGADLIDKQVRDHPTQAAFPKETHAHLNLLIEAIEHVGLQCKDLPEPESYVSPPVPYEMRQASSGAYPNWEELTEKQQRSVLEEIMDRDIRPYIALDGGGVEIKEIKSPFEVTIGYQGTCTSCFSSVGTTLSYIQQVLRANVHPNLVVIPQL